MKYNVWMCGRCSKICSPYARPIKKCQYCGHEVLLAETLKGKELKQRLRSEIAMIERGIENRLVGPEKRGKVQSRTEILHE